MEGQEVSESEDAGEDEVRRRARQKYEEASESELRTIRRLFVEQARATVEQLRRQEQARHAPGHPARATAPVPAPSDTVHDDDDLSESDKEEDDADDEYQDRSDNDRPEEQADSDVYDLCEFTTWYLVDMSGNAALLLSNTTFRFLCRFDRLLSLPLPLVIFWRVSSFPAFCRRWRRATELCHE